MKTLNVRVLLDNFGSFTQHLDSEVLEASEVLEFSRAVSIVCDTAMARVSGRRGKILCNVWWSPEFADLRRETLRRRRVMTKSDKDNSDVRRRKCEEYKALKQPEGL